MGTFCPQFRGSESTRTLQRVHEASPFKKLRTLWHHNYNIISLTFSMLKLVSNFVISVFPDYHFQSRSLLYQKKLHRSTNRKNNYRSLHRKMKQRTKHLIFLIHCLTKASILTNIHRSIHTSIHRSIYRSTNSKIKLRIKRLILLIQFLTRPSIHRSNLKERFIITKK